MGDKAKDVQRKAGKMSDPDDDTAPHWTEEVGRHFPGLEKIKSEYDGWFGGLP